MLTRFYSPFVLLWLVVVVMSHAVSPSTRTLSLEVTEASYEHARELCGKYMRASGGYIGQVDLRDTVERHYVVPCQVVMREAEARDEKR